MIFRISDMDMINLFWENGRSDSGSHTLTYLFNEWKKYPCEDPHISKLNLMASLDLSDAAVSKDQSLMLGSYNMAAEDYEYWQNHLRAHNKNNADNLIRITLH